MADPVYEYPIPEGRWGKTCAALCAAWHCYNRDLLEHYPRDYIDFSHPSSIISAPYDDPCAIRARVAAKSAEQRIRKGLSLFKVLVTDGRNDLMLLF